MKVGENNNVLSTNLAALVHIAGRLDQIANHISVPLTSTTPQINKEVMPNNGPKLNQKTLIEKRVEMQAPNNSWAMLNSSEKKCEDKNALCCFWAISGECDSNP